MCVHRSGGFLFDMIEQILTALESFSIIVEEQKTIIMHPKDFELMEVEEYKLEDNPMAQIMGMKLQLSEFVKRGTFLIHPMTEEEMEELEKLNK